jgi:hypothetical protein
MKFPDSQAELRIIFCKSVQCSLKLRNLYHSIQMQGRGKRNNCNKKRPAQMAGLFTIAIDTIIFSQQPSYLRFHCQT